MLIGAHPDDCEIKAGGTCARWAAAGVNVHIVCMTNGDAGHQEQSIEELGVRRIAEAAASAEVIGATSIVLDNHDGELLPTLEIRQEVIRIIRRAQADLVITHRPNDYHPDHRYTAQLVQDAAYMVTVPHVTPDVPALTHNPVFMYFMDRFDKPIPFHADVAIDVDEVMPTKWKMMHAMESQFYEWLAWHDGILDTVPADSTERLAWLEKTWGARFLPAVKMGRKAVKKWYGKKRAGEIRYAELFEISEYGRRPTRDEMRTLFPFLPTQKDLSDDA